jgi:endogenous inhibitor of DNA gyrase (YacG/DUF329 family)
VTESICRECGAKFVRKPDDPERPYDPERCGICIADAEPYRKP